MTENSTEYYNSSIPRIDPSKKKPWVEALRSDKYEQGQRMLKTPDGKYCCLGVYCDIEGVPEFLGPREVQIDGEFVTAEVPIFGHREFGSHTNIPNAYGIAHDLERSRISGYFFNGTENVFSIKRPEAAPGFNWDSYGLASLNDSGFTFAKIAYIIDYFL